VIGSELTLEVGKSYEDRKGDVWHVQSPRSGGIYLWNALRGKDGFVGSFTKGGGFFIGQVHNYDLIREIPSKEGGEQ
jgi:hypothetical protein